MTVTTLVSVKGAPGVTTLACLAAGTWPDDRRVVVVEADPFGGDLAARFQLSTAWGWSSYVTASRRSESVVPVEPHLQNLPGGVDVMIMPAGDRRLVDGASVDALLRSVHSSEGSPWDLVVDGGRLVAGTTAATPTASTVWLDRSDRVLVVTRRDPPSVLKVREQADSLRDRCGERVGLVVVGRGPHDTAAIAEFTGIPVLGAVPDDPAAARVVTGVPGSRRLLSRSLLVASARGLALLATATDEAEAPAETPIGGGPTGGTVVTRSGVWGLLGRLARAGTRVGPDVGDPAAGPADERHSEETTVPSPAATP